MTAYEKLRGAIVPRPAEDHLWMAPKPLREAVHRHALEASLLEAMLREKANGDHGVAIVIQGSGGFGKTTLARTVCNDERIRQAFDCCIWVELGRPPDLLAVINDVIHTLDRHEATFHSLSAASTALAKLMKRGSTLLVIDDVRAAADAEPFIVRGGFSCVVLTTRDASLLFQSDDQVLVVERMSTAEALQVLVAEQGLITPTVEADLEDLATRLYYWPLLLRLVGERIESLSRAGTALPEAVKHVTAVFKLKGPSAFDAGEQARRDRAVANTLMTCFEPIRQEFGEEWIRRFSTLGVFLVGCDIPVIVLCSLWKEAEPTVVQLASRMRDVFLLERFDEHSGLIRLHDEIADYLARQLPAEEARRLHEAILAQFSPDWSEPAENVYYWDNLLYHLLGAGRLDDAQRLALTLQFQERKCWYRGAWALEVDLRFAVSRWPADPALARACRTIANSAHLLQECDSLQEVRGVLVSRLSISGELVTCEEGPVLVPAIPLPDLPSAELVRTLSGHEDRVYGCAFAPRGDFVVSASADRTVRIWRTADGSSRPMRELHDGRVFGVRVSDDGRLIASVSHDQKVRIWDRSSGELRRVLIGHEGAVWDCDFEPGGRRLVSVGEDGALRVWVIDGNEGSKLLAPVTRVPLTGCSFVPGASLVVTAGNDGRVCLWDIVSGEGPIVIGSHRAAAWHCQVSGDGRFVVSSGVDYDVVVWNIVDRSCKTKLVGHSGPVWGCDTNEDCSRVLSASEDLTLRWWNVETSTCVRILEGHKRYVWSCAFCDASQTAASAALDGTLKLWSLAENG
jgi:hypothetical protein